MSGDELLEVNGRKLLGLYHADVVTILKELPMDVRLVCARPSSKVKEDKPSPSPVPSPSPAPISGMLLDFYLSMCHDIITSN